MIIVTTDCITGTKLEHLSLVQGNVVQSKHIGKDILAGLKTIVGGEIEVYTDLLREARGIATERMIEDAKRMGADAIVTVRYATADIMDTATEVMAYGTAVKFIQ